jgi:hypothetical protein
MNQLSRFLITNTSSAQTVTTIPTSIRPIAVTCPRSRQLESGQGHYPFEVPILDTYSRRVVLY